MENLSPELKCEVYIGLIHLRENPIYEILDDLVTQINKEKLAYTALKFLEKNKNIFKEGVVKITACDSPIQNIFRYMKRSSLPITTGNVMKKFLEILADFEKTLFNILYQPLMESMIKGIKLSSANATGSTGPTKLG